MLAFVDVDWDVDGNVVGDQELPLPLLVVVFDGEDEVEDGNVVGDHELPLLLLLRPVVVVD